MRYALLCYGNTPGWYIALLTQDKLGGQKANFVERVLDVRQGELCWVVGTVYMEMAEKPNVLDDIEKDVQFAI